jgi:hypothetical protein
MRGDSPGRLSGLKTRCLDEFSIERGQAEESTRIADIERQKTSLETKMN